MHGNAARRDELDHRVGDLLAEPLLHREPPRIEADEARELRDAEDLAVGDVRDVRLAVERERMVLAEREERDRALTVWLGRPGEASRRPDREARRRLRAAAQ